MEFARLAQIQIIILSGAVVALVTRRLRIPYTVGLVIAGVGLAVCGIRFEVGLSRDLLFDVLLPPLIFEAALFIDWKELRRDLLAISTFATLGVLLSAAVTIVIMHYAAGWEWAAALLFGVLVAATDPVAVIAIFKESKIKGRLRLLVEAESLFNDGTAAVLFALALAVAGGQAMGAGEAAWTIVLSIAGGITCGLAVAGLAYLIAGRTEDHLVELSLTCVAAFGSFWLAEYFHMSGILATTAAGLLFGNLRAFGTLTEKGESYIETFWDFAAFAANSVIFLLLGVSAAYQNFREFAASIGIAIVAVLLGRAIAVYPCAAAFSRTKAKISFRHQHVMFWGGLRGALALALAVGIPESLPYRQQILTVTFAVVAFSVIVQGTTISWVLRRLARDIGPAEAS